MEMSKIKEYASFAADLITITGLSFAFVWGFFKKTKTPFGFKINQFMNGLSKTGVIVFVYIMMTYYLKTLYEIVDKHLTNNVQFLGKWEWIHYALVCFVVMAVGIPFYWMIALKIWFNMEKISERLFGKFESFILAKEEDDYMLNIIKAKYKTDDAHCIDVSSQLRQMVRRNKLKITSSNELAGDPHPRHVKNLIVDYKIGDVYKKEIIREGETKIIPS